MTTTNDCTGYRSSGNRSDIGNRLTSQVTEVAGVTDLCRSTDGEGPTIDRRPDNPPRRNRGAGTRMGTSRHHMTIAAFCVEFEIAKSTFYDWRAKGRAPKCIKLPNGDLRIRRVDLDAWISSCEEAA